MQRKKKNSNKYSTLEDFSWVRGKLVQVLIFSFSTRKGIKKKDKEMNEKKKKKHKDDERNNNGDCFAKKDLIQPSFF